MERTEIEQVLANWIEQATSRDGKLVDGIDPAKWIAANFLNWWHPTVDDSLSDAESAARRLREELSRLGGWENAEFGEVFHELTHVTEALAELRVALGLQSNEIKSDS
jgi:hypothetical protein